MQRPLPGTVVYRRNADDPEPVITEQAHLIALTRRLRERLSEWFDANLKAAELPDPAWAKLYASYARVVADLLTDRCQVARAGGGAEPDLSAADVDREISALVRERVQKMPSDEFERLMAMRGH